MNQPPPRSNFNTDALDCLVNTNDLTMDDDVANQKYDQRSNSRREQSSKRSNRHSPPSVTRKRHASPQSMSSTRSRHHHHYPSQRQQRPVTPSPSPPPPSSRHRRPAISIKRPHSKSRSPYDRRPPTHRSRPESSKDKTIDDVLSSIASSDEHKTSKKPTSKQDTGDLSLISEDELIKSHDIRSNGPTTNESTSTSNKLHSTPSVPILQPNSNDNPLDMSNISQDCELSLFAKSFLSNNNSILPTSMPVMTDCMQTIDLITKYKMMQGIPNTNPQIEACSKDILILIQKQIELQKIELNYREREIKLRERELAEREKHLNEITSMTSVNNEPSSEMKSAIIEDKPLIINNEDMKSVSQEESVTKTINQTVDAPRITLSNKSGPRKTSRFSQLVVDPSIFASDHKPVDLYSDDHDDNQSSSSSSLNPNNSLKTNPISKILAPTESTISIVDTDLKVTSSNSCRKVEFQSGGNIDKTSKGSTTHDLRLTLSNKNRAKHQNNNDTDPNINTNELKNDNEYKSSKDNDKQQSHDYQQQRSVTSTSIESVIDNTNDKRDNHRQQQRSNNSRQKQYSSLSTNISNERSYPHESPSQQSFRYGSNQKRQETDDLRSRLFENKHPKSSRTTHRNNY